MSEYKIIAVILENTKFPILRMHIKCHKKISNSSLYKYIPKMIETGLLEFTQDKKYVRTSKGFRFLEAFLQMEHILACDGEFETCPRRNT